MWRRIYDELTAIMPDKSVIYGGLISQLREKKEKNIEIRAVIGRGRFCDEKFHLRRAVERSSCN